MEGRFNGGFLRYRFGGLIHGGAYFRNFTVLKSSLFFYSLKPSTGTYKIHFR